MICHDRFVRWRAAGIWDRILEAISVAYDGDLVMIGSSWVRVRQHGAVAKRGLTTSSEQDLMPVAAETALTKGDDSL